MAYNFDIPVGTTGSTFSATIDTGTYSCNMSEEYLSSPQIRFRYNCTYTGYSGPDPCYVNSDTVASFTPSSYGKVGLSIPQIQSHGIKAYSQPNDYTNSYALFTTVEYANSWGGDPRTQNTAEIPYYGFNWTQSQITGISQWTLSTNIPIFETNEDLQTYLTTGEGIEKAVNYVYSPILGTYDYVTETKNVHERLTDRYCCTSEEKYKNRPIFWCDGRVSTRTSSGNIHYSCTLQHPYNTDRAALKITKANGYFMGASRKSDSTTLTIDYVLHWDNGSTSTSSWNENFDGLVWAYTTATLEVSTNIPVFKNHNDAMAYINANSQEVALQAITKAINYRPVAISGDKFTTAHINLLRRRLINLVVGEPDWSQYFNYTIAEGYAWVTSVKRDEWLADFGNLDIYIPDIIEGYPVVLVNDDGHY